METSSPWALRWRALVGTLALCALVVLGAVVRSAGAAQQELGIDRILQLAHPAVGTSCSWHILQLARSTTTTTIALALTTTAQGVGLAALVIGIIGLVGGKLARKLDTSVLRYAVCAIGLVLAVVLFVIG